MQAMQNTGFIASPVDDRDYVLESSQPSVVAPQFFKTDTSMLPILMQGQQPSCIGHSVARAVMFYWYKKTGKVVNLSPRFIYALAKANDGLPNDEGTFYRVALKMVQKYGVCEDSFFPNDVNLSLEEYKDASKISPEAYANAAQYKIGNYFQVKDTSFEGIKNAAFQNSLALAGMRISSNWWEREDGTISWNADDILPLRPSDPTHPLVGGHAIEVYASGMNIQYLINSWSTSWGYQGRGWYGKNEIPGIFESWVISDIPK